MEKEEISYKELEILMDFDFLITVTVAIGEVASLTGVPQRKIRYWDNKGIIEPEDRSSSYRQYNYVNVKKVVLIKELLDEGYTLEVAAKKVKERSLKITEVFEKLKEKKFKRENPIP